MHSALKLIESKQQNVTSIQIKITRERKKRTRMRTQKHFQMDSSSEIRTDECSEKKKRVYAKQMEQRS